MMSLDTFFIVLGSPAGTPEPGSLDALRKLLEAAGLMARTDVFLNKDHDKEIAPDGESKATLETVMKQAAEGLRVLTVRRGQKNKAVRLVKGKESWNLKLDPAQTLATLRTDLEQKGLIKPGDHFMKDGARVLAEGDFSVEEVVDGSSVLSIGPLPVQGVEKIVIAKGVSADKIQSLEIDVSQPIARLRARLEADRFMNGTDTFRACDGKAISRDQEPDCTINSAVGTSKFLTINSGWI